MADLILVRHAYAGDPDPEKFPDDSTRPLKKSKGVKQFKKAAAGLATLTIPDRVITSPAARCMQTASLLEWDAGWPAAVANAILDDGHQPADVVDMLRELDEWPCTVGLVGHGPNLVELLDYLIGPDNEAEYADGFSKGGAALVTVKKGIKPGTGTIAWYFTQKQLKKQH